MATAAGNIYIGLHVDSTRMKAFGAVADTVIRDSARMRSALGGTGRSVEQLRSQMGRGYQMRLFSDVLRQASSANNEVARLRATMLALSAVTGTSVTTGFAAAFLLQTADASNRLNNQLRTVTDTEENLIAVRKRLYDVSQDSRSDLQSTVTLYARVSRAAKEFGKSQEDLVRVAETVQKAFAIGGASQQEASGAAVQLSQGIASDRFSGDEYRSVSENAPVLLQEMARNLGVTIGKLREMAHAGELTGRVVTEAILGASQTIDESFNKTIPTVSQSLTRLNNAFTQNIGETDSAYGVTRRLSEGLSNLAENFDDVAKYAGIATVAVGALLAGRAAPGLLGKAGGGLTSLFVGGQGLAAKGTIAEMAKLRGELQSEMAALRQQAGVTTGANGKMSFVATPANLAIMDQYNEKVKAMQAVQLRAAKATTELTRATRLFSVAGRAAGGALALFGGPVGLAFFAAVAGITIMGSEAAKSAERTEGLKKEMLDLGLISKDFADQIAGANKSIKELSLDELRSKLSEVRGELERQTTGQPWWEKLFGQDTDNLTNNIDRLQSVLAGFSANSPFAAIGLGVSVGGFSQGDVPFLEQLQKLAMQARDGKLTATEFRDEWDRVSPTFQNVSKNAADMAVNVGRSIAVMEGLGLLAKETAGSLDALATAGRGDLLSSLDARTEATIAAVKAARDNAEILKALSDESVRSAGLSENDARIEKIAASLLKAAEDEAEARGVVLSLTEAQLRTEAERVAEAEDVADAEKKVAELRDSLNARGLTLVDREAAATVNDLFDQFRTGQVPVETMQSRLDEISKLRLSDTMDGLLEKIIAAIPQLATLLGIAQSFPGVGADGVGGGPSWDMLGRYKTTAAESSRIGADVVAGALDDARMPERDAAIKQQAQKLQDEAVKKGGYVDPDTAKRTAAEIIDLEAATKRAASASDDAAEAAKKYADGLAELQSEMATAPLSDFYKKVIDEADSLGISRKEIDAYIESLKRGTKAREAFYGKGNIDLNNRQVVRNPDGSISTEESMSFNENGKEVLVPTVFNGAHHNADEAIDNYHNTGQYLGMFDTPEEADQYAEALHERQDKFYSSVDASAKRLEDLAKTMREINNINILKDLQTERDLMFKGEAERNIYETLKDSGIELASAQGQIIANQIRMNYALGEARDIAVDFGQTFRQSFAQYMADADAAHEESRIQHINELLEEAGATGEEVSLAQRKAILEMADAMADAEHGATFMERAWKAAWKAIVDATTGAMETIASKLMEAGINGLFDNLLGTGGGGGNSLLGSILNAVIGGAAGGLGGGATGGVMGSGLWGSAIFSAHGNVFGGRGIGAYSNSVVSRPTVFPFAHGIGMMGEAGPEGILPLARTAHGDLGVHIANQNVPTPANSNGSSHTKIEIDARYAQEGVGAEIARALEDYDRALPGRVRGIIDKPYLR